VATTAASYSRVLGANDRMNLGVIGCGDRATQDLSQFQKDPNVNAAALCDVYAAKIDKMRSTAPDAKGFKDHRRLLEQKISTWC
jgi:predicted dehydrogenase